MARPKKEAAAKGGSMRVKAVDAISDGKGGYLLPGDTFDPVDAEAAASLKAKGFAE